MNKYAPMVVKAARVLCQRGAELCNVDYDDSWKMYGEDYLNDAQAMLDAIGAHEMLAALYAVLHDCDDLDMVQSNEPGRDKGPWLMANEAIAKATGGQS